MLAGRNTFSRLGAALAVCSVAWLYVAAVRGPQGAIAQLTYAPAGSAPSPLISGFSVPTAHHKVQVVLRSSWVKGEAVPSALDGFTTHGPEGRILADDRVQGTFWRQAESAEASLNFSGLRAATVVVSPAGIDPARSSVVVQASPAAGFIGLQGVSLRGNFAPAEEVQEFWLETRRAFGGSFEVLIRGVGPTLRSFGVPDVVEDPVVEVYDERNERIAWNDDWDAGGPTAPAPASAFPLLPQGKDAAVICRLEGGGKYKILLRRKGRSGSDFLIDVTSLR